MLCRELNCHVMAADINPYFAESFGDIPARFVQIDVINGEACRTLPGPFDRILLMDVLEHLADPTVAIRNLRPLLARDGNFVITLPYVVVWHVRLPFVLGHFDYRETGTLDRTHVRFFTESTLCEFLRAASLDTTELDSTWNIPGLGQIASWSMLAEVDDLETKVSRRTSRLEPMLLPLLRAQRHVNHHGWLRVVNEVGRVLQRTNHGLWTNHFLVLARPRKDR